MNDMSQIAEHMEVISADGAHVGAVDHVQGDRIKLTRKDPGAGGKHHYVSVGLIAGVEGDKVRLSVSSQNVTSLWEEDPAESQGGDMGGVGNNTNAMPGQTQGSAN